jgi:hypothetical protein
LLLSEFRTYRGFARRSLAILAAASAVLRTSSVDDGVVRVADTFFIPVRESKAGTLALQTGRLRTGERVGLAFTTEASLLLTMGSAPRWVRLGSQALKDMLAPLGVRHIRVDPVPLRSGSARGLVLECGSEQRGAA